MCNFAIINFGEKMKRLFVIIYILSSINIYSQFIGVEDINESNLKPWNTKSTTEYQGTYHFGFSEAESSLRVIVYENNVIAQLQEGYFENSNKWMYKYETFKNVKIIGNKFYSDKTNGEFVIYKDEGKMIYGLKVNKSWSGVRESKLYEIGYKNGNIEITYSGKYLQSSIKKLDKIDLQKYSKKELLIMRNEIYARYNYIFKTNSEMKNYFNNQTWYNSQLPSVDSLLTDIEKYNIKWRFRLLCG
jgi:hypothetical protein